MANKQIGVNLAFSADTSKAKAQLRDLQTQLSNLSSNAILKVNADSSTIHTAMQDISKLQAQLKNATNVNTGLLDLSKFNDSMIKSGMSVEKYKRSLSSLGTEGQKAFLTLTNSIMSAETPLRRTNAFLSNMATTFSNTVKWQASSSIIHGIMGAMQGAYGYAKNLNESLNNIRIVTGQSADQMAQFAKEANKAAKALSSTTTEYTDAALIYYQQGLTGEQVKERAETTLKMANVSRQSAETVSQQMTSVWNNFYDGGKSLEYYSDVMVALGAATASSSDEIATGLEKFSAVSNTVGLSYEYAAAALATVTAQTRQSADTVGTAFRTLFTRLEGLNLGETAEDGTTLNKYSEALYKVGVNIKDQQGQLKDMDQILDELGAKWQTIGKEQQVALAQTVGGARQYATLIALMDNWDFFQKNLGVAKTSEGSLQEQADTYAESWEAARERVTTALEDIYDSILNDKFFIGLLNGFEKILDVIGNVTDAIGGFRGIFLGISSLITTVFAKNISQGITAIGTNLHNIKNWGNKEAIVANDIQIKNSWAKAMGNMAVNTGTAEGAAIDTVFSRRADLYTTFINNAQNMSEIEKQQYQIELDTLRVLEEQIIAQSKLTDQAEAEATIARQNLSRKQTTGISNLNLSKENEKLFNAEMQYSKNEAFLNKIAGKSENSLTKEEQEQLRALAGKSRAKIFKNVLKAADENNRKTIEQNRNAYTAATGIRTNEQEVQQMIRTTQQLNEVRDKGEKMTEVHAKSQKELNDAMKDSGQITISTAQKMTAYAQAAMGALTIINALKGIISTITDDTLSPFEKFTTILTTIITVAPMVITTFGAAIPILTATGGAGGAAAAGLTATGTAAGFASKALLKLKGVLSFFSGGLGIAIMAITALGAVLFAISTNSFEEKIKKANKELEETRKAANEASNAYQDLNSSLEKLQSAEETLGTLTKGTEEWNNAVVKLNQQVLDLIKLYPELTKYMSNEDGILRISEEGKRLVLSAQREQAQALQVATLSKQRNILALKNEDFQGKGNKYSYTVGEDRSRDFLFKNEWVASIGEEILSNNALTNGKIDWSKISNDVADEQRIVIEKNISSVLNLTEQFRKLNDDLKTFDENINKSWLNSIGIPEEIADYYSKGLLKESEKYKDTTEKKVEAASKEELVSAYSQITKMSEETINNLLKEGQLTEEILEDIILTNSINTQAYQDVLNNVNTITDATAPGQDIDILKNIVAAGGDASSYSTLTPEQVEHLNTLLTDKNNIELQEAVNNVLGEGFTNTLLTVINDGNYQQKVQEELEKRYQNKLSTKATSLGVNEDALEGFVNHLEASEKGLQGNKEAALEAAEAIIQYQRGAEDLAKAFKDNEEALKSTNKNTWEYYEALGEVQKATSDMFGLDLNIEYIETHLQDLRKAAEGDEKAIKNLQSTMASSWAKDFAEGVESVAEVLDEEGNIIEKGFDAESWRTKFVSSVESVNAALASMSDTFTLDQALDKGVEGMDGLIASVNEAALAGKMSATEIEALFGSMGYSPEITWKEVPGPSTSWSASARIFADENGEGGIPITVAGETANAIAVPQIEDGNGDGKTTMTKITPSNTLGSNIKASGNSTGGGSKKSKKKAADEIERYHVVKEQLEDIEQELDRISKAKERAFGGDKLKLMDDEIAKTQELLDKEQEYFDQINANYGPDRKALEAYGAKFDANGAIINYDSLMNAQINAFNSSLSDEAEEKYNNFKELIDQYEETDDLLAEQRQKLINLQNEIFDLMLEKLEYEVKLKIDVNEDANKYLDFLMEMSGDGMEHALDNIDRLGEKITNGLEDIQTYTNALNKMFKNRGYKGNVVEDLQSGKITPEELAEMYDLTEAEVDLLREYMGNIMDTTKEIQNMRREITDQLIDAMEEINEKFDEQIDKINRAAEGMQHYRDIIDLVGQDVLGISDEMIEMFSEKQLNNSIANVSATRTKMLENEREYNEAVAELERLKDTGASEFAIEEQERVVEAAREHLYDSTNEFNSAWKDALEQAREHFDTIIEQITTAFEEAMSGIYGNLDALQDAYDRQSEINERYLEDYEKIYELSKLNRDIGNSIDDTDSIRAKQALLELQEEINALEESGAEISKYDLDFLRQKYELRLAEIALEEAQNAKSQVRMTRDSEGNWNYTYTANEENISKAEQNYEDALYKTQQLTTEYIKDLENRIFQLNTDLVNALSNIDPNDAEGRQRIYDYYMGQNNYLTSQLNSALGNNADIYNQDWMNYSNATGYKISDNEKWMDSFNETTLSMLTGYSSLGEYQNAFRDSSLLMYNSINDAASEFAANTEIVMNAAGTSIETFAEDAEEAFKNFSISTKEATDSIDGIDKEAKETFDAILDKLEEFNKAYDEQIQQTIKANQDLIKSFNDLIAKEAEAKAGGGSGSNNSFSGSGNNGKNDPSGPSEPPTSPLTNNVVVEETWSAWKDTGAKRSEGNKVEKQQYRISNKNRTEYRWITTGTNVTAGRNGYTSFTTVSMYDTGGYTGAWGTTAGKLAMLHEKELVLNKQDTENILQSVNLVRQISDWISGRVNAMQYGSMLSAFGLPGDNRNVLEQMVTIHAEFPNANNRAEIEAAFDNLVNRAAQYAYRK